MKKHTVCPRFKPLECFDGTPISGQCSHCAFFSTKNCHKSSMDYLEAEEDIY